MAILVVAFQALGYKIRCIFLTKYEVKRIFQLSKKLRPNLIASLFNLMRHPNRQNAKRDNFIQLKKYLSYFVPIC